MEAVISTEMLNEIRNCFDHLSRAEAGSYPKENINKAISHLDRASLDCAKISWVACKKEVEKMYNAYSPKQLMLIEGGSFYEKIKALLDDFRDKSKNARLGEAENAHGAITESITLYFEAIDVGEKIKADINSKLNDLQHVVTMVDKGDFWHNLKWSVVGAIIGVLLTLLVQNYSNNLTPVNHTSITKTDKPF